MKKIPLTQNKYALVDDSDFNYLNNWSWYYHKTGYAVRSDYSSGKIRTIKMHREILNLKNPKIFADHINRDRLDNRRNNLRKTTNQKNCFNAKAKSTNTSGFKGVSYHKINKNWIAYINANKRYFLGVFKDKQEAAYIYDQFAMQLHGEFARLNYEY